jgi:ABC-2 type transport system ATP-binding protein
MSTVIQAVGLTRRFGKFVAVDHLTFEVQAGQVLGYLGPNGSGKTTTIRMLMGLLHPSEGQAQVLGYDVVSQAEQVRARSGYMSQKFSLYNELTVQENLAFYAGLYGVEDANRVSELLESLGLAEVRDQRVQNISAGWRQRLALATAIVHKPGLLFLDEPTSGVDPLARRAFWDLIYRLSGQGITVMVTTHYMDEAEYCSVVGIMRAGKLLVLDEPEHLKSSLPGKVWEVFATPLLQGLEFLEALPGVVHSMLASDHLRIIATNGVDADQITRGLVSAGLQVQSVQPGLPTMEDVFMSFSGEAI